MHSLIALATAKSAKDKRREVRAHFLLLCFSALQGGFQEQKPPTLAYGSGTPNSWRTSV